MSDPILHLGVTEASSASDDLDVHAEELRLGDAEGRGDAHPVLGHDFGEAGQRRLLDVELVFLVQDEGVGEVAKNLVAPKP